MDSFIFDGCSINYRWNIYGICHIHFGEFASLKPIREAVFDALYWKWKCAAVQLNNFIIMILSKYSQWIGTHNFNGNTFYSAFYESNFVILMDTKWPLNNEILRPKDIIFNFHYIYGSANRKFMVKTSVLQMKIGPLTLCDGIWRRHFETMFSFGLFFFPQT